MKRILILSALFGAMMAANAQTVSTEANQDRQTTKAVSCDDTVYTVAEQMPAFPGGEAGLMKYVASNLKFPVSAMESGVQGVVMVKFVVMEDGSVGEVCIERSMRKDIAPLSKKEYKQSHPKAKSRDYEKYVTFVNREREAGAACDAEAVRLVKSLPRFIPGKQQDKAVRVWYTLPLRFIQR